MSFLAAGVRDLAGIPLINIEPAVVSEDPVNALNVVPDQINTARVSGSSCVNFAVGGVIQREHAREALRIRRGAAIELVASLFDPFELLQPEDSSARICDSLFPSPCPAFTVASSIWS